MFIIPVVMFSSSVLGPLSMTGVLLALIGIGDRWSFTLCVQHWLQNVTHRNRRSVCSEPAVALLMSNGSVIFTLSWFYIVNYQILVVPKESKIIWS